MVYLAIALIVVLILVVWRARAARRDLEWSRQKAIVAYADEYFGHHFVYVDASHSVLLLLPRDDATIEVITGDFVGSDQVRRFRDGALESRGGRLEWKIGPKRILYKVRPGPPIPAGIYSVEPFPGRITEAFVANRLKELHAIISCKAELPLTAHSGFN
jgi:hypothetical protein